jgi:glycosyltransferase involved in cell wall biosynthesis
MQKKINVLMVITDLNLGGAERVLEMIVQNLDPQKYQFIICSLKKKGVIGQRLEKQGFKVIALHTGEKENIWNWLDGLRVLMHLFLICRREKIDLIHSHLFRANVLSRIAGGLLVGTPFIISSIHILEEEKKYHLWLEHLTSPLADKIIAVGEEVKKFMIEKAKIPTDKLLTIHNGIEINHLKKEISTQKLQKELKLKPETKIITTVGRLACQKGHIYLLQALKLVLEKEREVNLLVVGEGPLRKFLEEISREMGVREKVSFLGVRENIEEILALTDIFVSASLWEGLPLSVMEAMASGRPVIVTDIASHRELVEDRVTGLLVPVKNPFALAKAIKELLGHEERRREMGEAGRQKVEKNFSLQKMVEKTERLYQDLLREGKKL